MNHYQRLKVAHDAPAEVIRAAYRALATKLHPDRQGPNTGPADVQHTEMAALNAAYETLIDPKLRADYDATLGPGAAKSSPWDQPMAEPGAGDHFEASPVHTKVDLDWLTPNRAPTSAISQPDRKMLIFGGAGALAVLAVGGVLLWQTLGQRQMEEALSRQYHEQGASGVLAADDLPLMPPRPMATSTDGRQRKPSVDELARMSDEELLKVLPTLDSKADAPASRAQRAGGGLGAAAAQHPLDGVPLRLRTEAQLVDPLAPEAPPRR